MSTRRDFLQAAGATSALSLVAPGLAVARTPTDRRFVTIILRGGLDGLAAVAPYRDRNLAALRPRIRTPEPGQAGGGLDLGSGFALHPGLEPFHALYRRQELAIVHAVGNSGRSRSHFDAQDMLENGTPSAKARRDGWLNRAIGEIERRQRQRRLGLSVGNGVPLVLRGDTSIRNWSPNGMPPATDGFLVRLASLYRSDPLFGKALTMARASEAMAARALGQRQRGGGRNRFPKLAEAAGKLLALRDGPRIATLELGGWDTHAGQMGALNRRLPVLANGIDELRGALGEHWSKTVVVVVSEFGRTARENGSRGTDHGTGGVVFLAGGAVRGGRVRGRWPGLSHDALYQGRDLAPTTDVRAILKGVLRDHLGLTEASLASRVFPDSAGVRPMASLVRR